MSKQTDVYVLAAYQMASRTTLSAFGRAIAVEASIGPDGINSAAHSQALEGIGIRQRVYVACT